MPYPPIKEKKWLTGEWVRINSDKEDEEPRFEWRILYQTRDEIHSWKSPMMCHSCEKVILPGVEMDCPNIDDIPNFLGVVWHATPDCQQKGRAYIAEMKATGKTVGMSEIVNKIQNKDAK